MTVEPENPIKLANEIKRCKENSQLLNDMHQNALKYISSYSRKLLTHQLSDTLKELI